MLWLTALGSVDQVFALRWESQGSRSLRVFSIVQIIVLGLCDGSLVTLSWRERGVEGCEEKWRGMFWILVFIGSSFEMGWIR